jgi:hypothetical protein
MQMLSDDLRLGTLLEDERGDMKAREKIRQTRR